MQTLVPKTYLETVSTMLVGAQDELTQLTVQERYLNRKYSGGDKSAEKSLANVQGQMRATQDFIEYLKEMVKEEEAKA